jgi:hypothetical protein
MADQGQDISCTDDLDPNLSWVDGLVSVQQALLRRYITPRGQLYRYPQYGFDLSRRIGVEQDTSTTRQGIENEALKDERISKVNADVLFVDTDELVLSTGLPLGSLVITISVVSSEGPFALVLSVDAVTREILELNKRILRD